MEEPTPSFTVIVDFARHAATCADLREAFDAARRVQAEDLSRTVIVFADLTGIYTELDPRGGEGDFDALVARLDPTLSASKVGRPKLGVVSREVSLLPRHWDWLGAQPGGASAAIRRLVDAARKERPYDGRARRAKDVACQFMGLLGGNHPNYEEATRALYADRFDDAVALVTDWPDGLGAHVARLVENARRWTQLSELPQGAAAAANSSATAE